MKVKLENSNGTQIVVVVFDGDTPFNNFMRLQLTVKDAAELVQKIQDVFSFCDVKES